MELFKALQEKKYSEIRDYCAEKISDIVAGKIDASRVSHLNKLRGIDENTEIIIKSDDKKDDDDKDSDKDDDKDEKKDSDKDDKKAKFPFKKKEDKDSDDDDELDDDDDK